MSPIIAPPSPFTHPTSLPLAAWRERFIIAIRIYVVAFVNLITIRAYEVRRCMLASRPVHPTTVAL